MASPQLTETSSRYTRKISGTTALQEALKEKQQHIEQLLAERDLERAEVAKATSHICEVEKEIALLKAQHEQVGAVGRLALCGQWRGPSVQRTLNGTHTLLKETLCPSLKALLCMCRGAWCCGRLRQDSKLEPSP